MMLREGGRFFIQTTSLCICLHRNESGGPQCISQSETEPATKSGIGAKERLCRPRYAEIVYYSGWFKEHYRPNVIFILEESKRSVRSLDEIIYNALTYINCASMLLPAIAAIVLRLCRCLPMLPQKNGEETLHPVTRNRSAGSSSACQQQARHAHCDQG